MRDGLIILSDTSKQLNYSLEVLRNRFDDLAKSVVDTDDVECGLF